MSGNNQDQRGWFHRQTGVPFYTINPFWAIQRQARMQQLRQDLVRNEAQRQHQLKLEADLDQQAKKTETDLALLTEGIQWSTKDEAELRKQELIVKARLREERTPRIRTVSESAQTAADLVIGKIPYFGKVYSAYGYYKAAKEAKEKLERMNAFNEELEDTQQKLESHKGFQEATSDEIARHQDQARRLREERVAAQNVIDNLQVAQQKMTQEQNNS